MTLSIGQACKLADEIIEMHGDLNYAEAIFRTRSSGGATIAELDRDDPFAVAFKRSRAVLEIVRRAVSRLEHAVDLPTPWLDLRASVESASEQLRDDKISEELRPTLARLDDIAADCFDLGLDLRKRLELITSRNEQRALEFHKLSRHVAELLPKLERLRPEPSTSFGGVSSELGRILSDARQHARWLPADERAQYREIIEGVESSFDRVRTAHTKSAAGAAGGSNFGEEVEAMATQLRAFGDDARRRYVPLAKGLLPVPALAFEL